MKRIIHLTLIFCFSCLLQTSFAQKSYGNLYNPEANAAVEIEETIKQAQKENKHIILQVGGNWCVWCYRFHDFVKENSELQKIADLNFIVYHLNYSKENKNDDLLAKYQHPERFGFPVILILNSNGELIHTQNSALLEEDKGYSTSKVKEFFLGWSPRALDPATYNKQ